MIEYLIEFLEGWKDASAFEQVTAWASIIAIVAGIFLWLRKKVRLSIHDKEIEINKLKGQVAGYRGKCKEFEAEIEVLRKRTVESRLQMVEAELADHNEERAYVLYEELLDHLKPAIDEACSVLASARAADTPLSGKQAKDEAIRLAEIVVRLGGDNAERMRMLLLELYAGFASEAIQERNDTARAAALDGLAQSFNVSGEDTESLENAAFRAYQEGKYILAEVLFRRFFVIVRRTGSPEALLSAKHAISVCL
jgi:TolA-binding protein